MKNIKDYLHLYLDCEIRMLHKATNEWSNPKKLTSNVLNQILMYDGDVNFSYQLLLYPLSFLNTIEGNRLRDKYRGLQYWKGQDDRIDTPNSFKFLLDNFFDVYGLIEQGLAIDATKLPTGSIA